MRKVIVNSTPLIVLGKIGRLDLLRMRYGEIIIPEAVFREVTEKNDKAKEELLSAGGWIHVQAVQNKDDRRMYKAKLHDGEVEVMLLAQEIHADVVIIDDGPARKTADYLGLPLTGTIGVLIKCKECGYIDAVMPVLEELRQIGFHIDQRTMETVHSVVKE